MGNLQHHFLLTAWQIAGFSLAAAVFLLISDIHQSTRLALQILLFCSLSGMIVAGALISGDRIRPNQRRRTRAYLSLMLLLLVSILAGYQLATFLASAVCPPAEFHLFNRDHVMALLAAFLLSMLLAGIYGWAWVYRQQDRLNESKLRRLSEWEELRNRSHLEELRTRINPHFLFRALTTVMELQHSAPQRLEAFLRRLISIYQRLFTLSDQQLISLDEELELVTQYVEIEKEKRQNSLSFEISADASLMELRIYPLTIAQLVENALNRTPPNGKEIKLFVGAHRVSNQLFIHVRDNIVNGEKSPENPRLELYFLKQRIRMYYGERATVETAEIAGGGRQLIIGLPYADVTPARRFKEVPAAAAGR